MYEYDGGLEAAEGFRDRLSAPIEPRAKRPLLAVWYFWFEKRFARPERGDKTRGRIQTGVQNPQVLHHTRGRGRLRPFDLTLSAECAIMRAGFVKGWSNMKRMSSLLCAVCLCAAAFAGCTPAGDPNAYSAPEQDGVCAAWMDALREAGTGMACDVVRSYGEKDYATYFEYWYDMPMQFVSDGAICYVGDGDNVDEISILRPVGEVTRETVKKALTNRIERQRKRYKGLIDEQADRMDNAVIVESGGYLLFLVSDDPAPVQAKFEELTR